MAFEELKAQQSRMWGAGSFERLAETIADVHDELVGRLEPRPGERWLDLASGTGGVAERAARAGASVTGVDLAPALVETARRRAGEIGLAIDYRVGDCERLDDIADGAFDVVSSSFGIVFAPDHDATAAELARVVRPGGRLGLATWTPDGGVGRMFRMLAPFQPPPPEGAGSPLSWGDEQHVRALLDPAFELRFVHGTTTMHAADGEAMWDELAATLGPLKMLAESLPPERLAELRRTAVDFFETQYRRDGAIAHDRDYALVLGTRR